MMPDRTNSQKTKQTLVKSATIPKKAVVVTPSADMAGKQTKNGVVRGLESNKKPNTKALTKTEGKAGVKRKEVATAMERQQTTKLEAKVKNPTNAAASPRKKPNLEKPKKESDIKDREKTAAKPALNLPAPENKNSSNGFNPLDNIMNEIEAFDTSNKPPKSKKKREKAPKIESPKEFDEGANSPTTSQQLPPPPTPLPGSSSRPLMKSELARQEQDNTMVQQFLHREDLLERILAYKMLRGRVESYLTMKSKIDLNSCVMQEYELRPDLVDPVSVRLHPKLEPPLVKEDLPHQMDSIPPLLSLNQLPMMGPMTPPGSPGTNRSSTSANEQQQNDHYQFGTHATCSRLPPPPALPKIKKNEPSGEDMLKKFGVLLGVPEHKIRNFLGDDLQKLENLKTEDWLETFRESLKNMAEKKEFRDQGQSKTSKSPVPSTSNIKEEANSAMASSLAGQKLHHFGFFSSDQLAAQPGVSTVDMGEAMEISSESSASSSSTSSGLFLPPPPPPPPMFSAESPPPPPTIGNKSADEQSIPPPPPPPPPFGIETAFSHSETPSFSSRAVNLSTANSSSRPPIIRRPPRRYGEQQSANYQRKRGLDTKRKGGGRLDRGGNSGRRERGNNRRASNNRDRAEIAISHRERTTSTLSGRKRPSTEPTMTAACAKPVSLLSLNILQPRSSSTSRPAVTNTTATTTSAIASSMPTSSSSFASFPTVAMQGQNNSEQAATKTTFSTPKRPTPSNRLFEPPNPPALLPPKPPPLCSSGGASVPKKPVQLNMEFIKNTPPPPIPEIIRKTMPNRTGNTVTLPTPTHPSVLSRPPAPPQLMHMDLQMPGSLFGSMMRPQVPELNLAMPPPPMPMKFPPLPVRIGHQDLLQQSPNLPSHSSVLKTLVQAISGKTTNETASATNQQLGGGTSTAAGTMATSSSPYGVFLILTTYNTYHKIHQYLYFLQYVPIPFCIHMKFDICIDRF